MTGYLKYGQKYVIKEGKAIITGNCKITGEPYNLVVDADQFLRWKQGALIQSAMPDLSESGKQILSAGIVKSDNLLLG